MKHYLFLLALMVVLLLGLFALAEALDIPLLTHPEPWLAHGGLVGGLLGVSLLVADVFLPVPSSLVMVAHGAIFGVAIGSVLSLAGCLGAGWLGFWVGRRGGPLLERWVPSEERLRAGRLLERWGGLAVVASRPVPILAETVAILAGTSALTWGEMTLATLLGSLPAALIYALSGAAVARSPDNFVLVFLLVLLLSAPMWFWMHKGRSRATSRQNRPQMADPDRAGGEEDENAVS